MSNHKGFSLSSGFGFQQNPDLQQQFQQQQTLMLNQCLQQMCMQQLELQNLQRQVNIFSDPYGGDIRLRSLQSLPTDSRNLSPNVESRQNPFSFQPQFPATFYGRRSNDSSPQINNNDNRPSLGQIKKSGRRKGSYDQYGQTEKKDRRETREEGVAMPLLNFDELRNRKK